MKALYQKGVSLIAAVFLITGLALLGAMASNLLIISTEETINEWYSAQALFAAESGIDWGAHQAQWLPRPHVCSGNTTAISTYTDTVDSSFTVNIYCHATGNLFLYRIQSEGNAGGSRAQRTLSVQFIPN